MPIYAQIVEQVRDWIAKGQLNPGDQLPTVRQLALELRVNLNTVARAYRILDEAGIISTQRGRGTYIWEKPTEETMRRLKEKPGRAGPHLSGRSRPPGFLPGRRGRKIETYLMRETRS